MFKCTMIGKNIFCLGVIFVGFTLCFFGTFLFLKGVANYLE